MGEQLHIGPFGFLAERVRVEMAEARAAGVKLCGAPSRRDATNRQRITHGALQRFFELVSATSWRVRSEAVQELFNAPQHEPARDWIELVYRLAFDDPDARVRGTCWLELAAASRDERHVGILTALTIRAFNERFHARAEFHDQLGPGARQWLLELAEELERPDWEQRAARIRDKHLEQLAGNDGPLINALAPEESARFLDHPEPGHRLAALDAISRIGRASLEHQARLLGLVKSLVSDDAARLVDDAAERRRLSELATSTSEAQLATHLGGRVRQMIASDPDPRVRTAAVTTLGYLYSGSGERHVERFLAEIVGNAARPDHTRYAAYDALARVRGVRACATPLVRAMNRSADDSLRAAMLLSGESVQGYNWEEDVDWNVVRGCA